MAGIARLAVVNDASGTTVGTPGGILAWTATASYVLSVVVTNKGTTNGTFYVWVAPTGTTSTPGSWGWIAYNLPLSTSNTYETFRFGVNNTDMVYVAGSAGMSYYIQGINQS